MAIPGRQGKAMRDQARRGMAGKAMRARARRGMAGGSRQIEAWLVRVWLGAAGAARLGKAWQASLGRGSKGTQKENTHYRVGGTVSAKVKTLNLCCMCELDFATCRAKKVVFAHDKDRSLRGAEADRVIKCSSFSRKATIPTPR